MPQEAPAARVRPPARSSSSRPAARPAAAFLMPPQQVAGLRMQGQGSQVLGAHYYRAGLLRTLAQFHQLLVDHPDLGVGVVVIDLERLGAVGFYEGELHAGGQQTPAHRPRQSRFLSAWQPSEPTYNSFIALPPPPPGRGRGARSASRPAPYAHSNAILASTTTAPSPRTAPVED